jgi:hypothetical protein
VRMYMIESSRVDRVWDFAQYHNLAMYRKRIQRVGHTHIQYVIEVPDSSLHTRLLLEHSEYLELV